MPPADDDPLPSRCYLICTVQRTGSWLLCHALEDSGLAGIPAEYFHRGDEAFWASRWQVSDDQAFIAAMLREEQTPNGVFGSKMMWNYLPDALTRLRTLSGGRPSSDAELFHYHLPGLRYVWLRRRDFVRQGVSWWRASVTGQYALSGDNQPASIPPPDYAEIANLVRLAEASDRGWHNWFVSQDITPLEVVYENLVDDIEGTVRRVLAFLEVEVQREPLGIQPRLRQQADEISERLVGEFLKAQSSNQS